MTNTIVNKERSIHESSNNGRRRQVEMKEALRLTSYANRPSRTSVLQIDKVIKKVYQTIKVTSQLTDENQIKRRIGNIKDISMG